MTNPAMIYRVLNVVTSSITTNPEFASTKALQDFALSLGSLKPSKINFVTTPYEIIEKGNVGWTAEADELWSALRMDTPWPEPVVTASASPGASSSPSAEPSTAPSPTTTSITAAAATCTEGNG